MSSLGGANSVTDPKVITPIAMPDRVRNRYNRSERRKSYFVIINLTNGQYVKMITKKDGTKLFKDVPLKDASLWMFNTLNNVMGHMILAEPNLDIDYRMVYRHNGEIKVK